MKFFRGLMNACLITLPFWIGMALMLFVKELWNILVGVGLFLVMLGIVKLLGG